MLTVAGSALPVCCRYGGMDWDTAVLKEKYMYDIWHRTYLTANTIQEKYLKNLLTQ
jgi:hypothetical protein